MFLEIIDKIMLGSNDGTDLSIVIFKIEVNYGNYHMSLLLV